MKTALYYQNFHPQEGPKGEPRKLYDNAVFARGRLAISPNGEQVAFVSTQSGFPLTKIRER